MVGFFERASIAGMILVVALAAAWLIGPLVGPALEEAAIAAESASAASSTTSLEIITSELYFDVIDPIEGNFEEKNLDEGPEGPMPRPPALGDGEVVRVFMLQEAGRKVFELRNQAGQIIARVQWTLSDPTNFFDDWTGGLVWSSHLKVATKYGGANLGVWMWKTAERIFYQPGITRVIIDESKTRSGQIGWTSYHISTVMAHIQTNVTSFTVLMSDTVNRIWVVQYAP